MKRVPVYLISIGILLGMAPSIHSQNLVGRTTSGLFGLKVGVISRMDLRGERRLNTEIGSTAQVFADFRKGQRLFIATAFDFYYVEVNRSNQIMIEPGVGVKYSFPIADAGATLKPGVMIGFAYLSDTGDLPAAELFSYKLLFEAEFKIDVKKAWLGEIALFDAPTGRSASKGITLGPGVMLRLGLAFR